MALHTPTGGVHLHTGGMQGALMFLFVVAAFGSLHLLAASHPNSVVSKAWIGGLGF